MQSHVFHAPSKNSDNRNKLCLTGGLFPRASPDEVGREVPIGRPAPPATLADARRWPGFGRRGGWPVRPDAAQDPHTRQRGRRRGTPSPPVGSERPLSQTDATVPIAPDVLPARARARARDIQWQLTRQCATVGTSYRLPESPCLAVFPSPVPFQRNAFVERLHGSAATALDSGDGGSKIAAEGLLGADRVPSLSLAP